MFGVASLWIIFAFPKDEIPRFTRKLSFRSESSGSGPLCVFILCAVCEQRNLFQLTDQPQQAPAQCSTAGTAFTCRLPSAQTAVEIKPAFHQEVIFGLDWLGN